MFLLSKLLPLLLLPLGLALLLLVWAVLRGGRAPVLAALGLLWLFATPLTAEGLWRWLERPYQRRPIDAVLRGFACEAPARSSSSGPSRSAEGFSATSGAMNPGAGHGAVGAPPASCAVVVLGTGRHAAPGPARVSEWTDADRFFAGIEAYQGLRTQGFRPRLIFTGGWWPTQPRLRPEGDELRLRAIALGLPPADLVSTARVQNTAEEARAIAALLPPDTAVVLVTSAFHMPRAQRLFKRQGLRVVPLPVDFQATGAWAGHPLADPLNYLPTADGLASSSRALREAIGRTIYRAW